MSEESEIAQHLQNFAEVHFELKNGKELMAPMKIFKEIDQEYQIATPVLDGYVLIKKPDSLVKKMATSQSAIRLVYDKIATLQIYHGLADMAGELITMHNSEQPDKVKPIKLQEIPAHDYYIMTDEGLGEKIENPTAYVPEDATVKTSLVSLTIAEKQKVDQMEDDLTINKESEVSAGVQLGNEATNQKEPDKVASKQPVSVNAPEPAVNQAATQETRTEVRQQRSAQRSPVTLLANALSLVLEALSNSEKQSEINSLTRSANQILSAIETLTLIDEKR